MALSELAAIEAAYHALLSLDEAGRGRALRWLSDALDAPSPLPEGALVVAATEAASAARPAAATATRRRTVAGSAARKTTRNGARTGRRGRGRAQAAATSGERAYRRMPDADEVMAAYRKVGSVSGHAEHFGVPTHTVQGWARRLREKGHQIGRQS